MKKVFLSFLTAIMAVTASFAQNSMVATLSHGEDITMFYGSYALRNAMEAAASGDIINLSGGAFQATHITKGVVLRGTGIDATSPTYILGDFDISIPTDDANRFSMEGIRCANNITMYGTFKNPYFVKCQFVSFFCYENVKNAMFANCKITDYYDQRDNCSSQFINCYLRFLGESSSFVNCVLRDAQDIGNSQLINCILYTNDNKWSNLPSSSYAINCVAVNYEWSFFALSQANTGCMSASFEEIFKGFTGGEPESQAFELTSEAKNKYLGNDGTEVGLYGGVLPYTTIPSYPQIKKMNVANKATADGKLSVEIEVSAAQ